MPITPNPPAVSGPSQMIEAGLHGKVGHTFSLVTSMTTHRRSIEAQQLLIGSQSIENKAASLKRALHASPSLSSALTPYYSFVWVLICPC